MRYEMICAAAAAAISSAAFADTVIDLNELPLAPDNYYNGADSAAQFTSKGVSFANSFTDWGGGFTSWAGFACSNVNDTTTPGFGNQYATYSGTGHGGSGNYAVGYQDFYGPVTPTLTLPLATSVRGAYLTNATYAALDMTSGSGFSKKFGGASGNDPDWFKLTITGKDAADATTGTVDFYLADYRFSDNNQDYIVKAWQWVDLSSLGSSVKSLQFSMTSSDNGSFGMNTPSYFALDDLTVAAVPEPAAVATIGMALLLPLTRRRRA